MLQKYELFLRNPNFLQEKLFPAAICVSKSKSAQAEYKAKARFLALLRRRRFSSKAQRALLFISFADMRRDYLVVTEQADGITSTLMIISNINHNIGNVVIITKM